MSINRLAAATLTSLLAGFSTMAAAQECQSVDSPLTGVVVDAGNYLSESQIESGPLQGTASFSGDGQSITQVAGVSAVPVAELNFALTTGFDITTAEGTVTTVGVGALEAARNGLASYYHRVTGGTGAFEGATGFLFTHFVLNDDASGFNGGINGQICMATASTATEEESESPLEEDDNESAPTEE